jgi:soluble lytic murein transglycosylase
MYRNRRRTRFIVKVFPFILFLFVSSLLHARELNSYFAFHTEKSQQSTDMQIEEAIKLINNGSYRQAETILLPLESNNSLRYRVFFLLGILYKEEGVYEKAREYLIKARNMYPLLKDYALKSLAETYVAEKKHREAIEVVRKIRNKALLQSAQEVKINALLELKNEEAARRALSEYTRLFPFEWESKLLLARLLKKSGHKNDAISLFKEIYIKAVPLSEEALNELKELKSDSLTLKETLKRADNLFKNRGFKRAEHAYKSVLEDVSMYDLKDKIRFSIGLCQFNQKKYSLAAQSFSLIKTPKAMYWETRARYRSTGIDDFERMIEKFKINFPKSKYLAKLLLALADEKRRSHKLSEAKEIYRYIINGFPSNGKDALWGLGWMNYSQEDYKESEKIFSRLALSVRDNGKYLYWKAKSNEMRSKDCVVQKVSLNIEVNPCSDTETVYNSLLGDTGYYGFLAKIKLEEFNMPDKRETKKPEMPSGDIYRRIEALKFLGMYKEAIDEIRIALGFRNSHKEFRYLAHTAYELGEYKSILYFAESLKEKEFLPLAYPLGFWNIVSEVSESEDVDPYLVIALIREESRFDPDAVSSAGAIGLMQLMPFTARRIKKELKIELSDSSEIHEVEKNISLGTRYFSKLLKEFGRIPLAIAAYNAGENALRRWLRESNHKGIDEFIEDIPYQETKDYVKKVLKSYWQYKTLQGLPLTKEKE